MLCVCDQTKYSIVKRLDVLVWKISFLTLGIHNLYCVSKKFVYFTFGFVHTFVLYLRSPILKVMNMTPFWTPNLYTLRHLTYCWNLYYTVNFVCGYFSPMSSRGDWVHSPSVERRIDSETHLWLRGSDTECTTSDTQKWSVVHTFNVCIS